MDPVKVLRAVQTCDACPSQWEGEAADGRRVYARYRWGHLEVELDGEPVFAKQLRGDDSDEDEAMYASMRANGCSEESVAQMQQTTKLMRDFAAEHGRFMCFHGVLTYDELRAATAGVLEWPDSGVDDIKPHLAGAIMGQLQAPWNDDQVASLNGYQEAGFVHPFTCRCGNILCATTNGWVCDQCDYTQNWCHDFMANWSWKEMDVFK